MECPKELRGEQRSLWKRLFAHFAARNPVEIEMAKRYLVWLLAYESSKREVDANGMVVTGANGLCYTNPHYSNMVRAEGEMRRLWRQLQPAMQQPSEDDSDLGEFASL